MKKPIGFQRFVNGEDGQGLPEELKGQLERVINESFRERGFELVPDYFRLPIWHHFAYMISARELQDNKLVGGLLAFRKRTELGINYVLYDKIFMHPDCRGNGAYKTMIAKARVIDGMLTIPHNGTRRPPIPAGLRTSELGLCRMYQQVSDTGATYSVQHNGEPITYFVQLFGMLQPILKKPIPENYPHLYDIAEHIARLPPTLRKLNVQICPDQNIY